MKNNIDNDNSKWYRVTIIVVWCTKEKSEIHLVDQIWDIVQDIYTDCCNNKKYFETSRDNDGISTKIDQADQTSNIDDVNAHMNEFYCKRVVSISLTLNLYLNFLDL